MANNETPQFSFAEEEPDNSMFPVMMTLGFFPFMLNTATYNKLIYTNSYEWAEKKRLPPSKDKLWQDIGNSLIGRGGPALQYMGQGSEIIDLEGFIYPIQFGGLGSFTWSLKLLRAMAAFGKPYLLLNNSGQTAGMYVIKEVVETHDGAGGFKTENTYRSDTRYSKTRSDKDLLYRANHPVKIHFTMKLQKHVNYDLFSKSLWNFKNPVMLLMVSGVLSAVLSSKIGSNKKKKKQEKVEIPTLTAENEKAVEVNSEIVSVILEIETLHQEVNETGFDEVEGHKTLLQLKGRVKNQEVVVSTLTNTLTKSNDKIEALSKTGIDLSTDNTKELETLEKGAKTLENHLLSIRTKLVNLESKIDSLKDNLGTGSDLFEDTEGLKDKVNSLKNMIPQQEAQS